MKKKISLLLLGVLIVGGCKSIDPYTGEEQFSNSSKYALGGALAGAATGQLAGKDTESTLTGVAVGALAGAGLGYYFDRQETALRAELQRTGVSLKRNGNKLELVMPGNLTFKSSSSDINSNFYEVLDSVAKVLKEYDETSVFVSGHTDNTGKDSYNMTLSKDRADSVAKYLKSRGVQGSRLTTEGFGSKYPLTTNSTSQGRENNRRVEIEIIAR
ncbi:cell envelope biogenesis protein OmpA [Propionigenium maris DSM 9537]|uniref:Cell envelope biogenesis protein OmpA n=1 Tax=Propionigenium maris DSM 9537 TaxID=1123000 RepID=A0A9W6GN22_9FUSO|nr:OmpA family protein [Propionigenium maris]GLI56577.1 cell envelope biogenesis protein OmpA [Propionigenium maris DSM 9537]